MHRYVHAMHMLHVHAHVHAHVQAPVHAHVCVRLPSQEVITGRFSSNEVTPGACTSSLMAQNQRRPPPVDRGAPSGR
jgi:hypothetical protein